MVNKVILVGFVGKDVEVKYTNSGQAVAAIRLATSRSWTDKDSGKRKEDTEWHDVETWGKVAEACGKHVTKGAPLYVEGRIKTERWDDKESGAKRSRVKIVAERIQFLGKVNGKGGAQPEQPDDSGAPADDDLPC